MPQPAASTRLPVASARSGTAFLIDMGAAHFDLLSRILITLKLSISCCDAAFCVTLEDSFKMEDVDETPPLKVDPYQVLEIETTATTNEVKSAYRKLALRHHPGRSATHSTMDHTLTKHYRQGTSRTKRDCPYQIPRDRFCVCHPFRRAQTKTL